MSGRARRRVDRLRSIPAVVVLLAGALPAGLGLAGPAAAVVPAAVLASPGHPGGGLAGAQARAATLRAEVDRLQVQAEAATEDYDGATAELGSLVTAHLRAGAQLADAQAAAAASADTADNRIRAIYEAGGRTALMASVLDGHSPAEVLQRYTAVSSVIAADRTIAGAAAGSSAAAAAAERRLRDLTVRQAALETRAATAAAAVRAALARSSALVAAADAQVRAIAETQRVAAAAAAARAAAATLAAARATAERSGPLTGFAAGSGLSAPSAVAAAAVAAALSRVGSPYIWGATGPDSFDCSGLTGWAYAAAGLTLPRTSRQQWYGGPHVDLGALAPGDLLFWASDRTRPGTIHHVAIYLGNGSMVAAPHAGTLVQVQPVYLDGYIGAVRPAGAAGTG